MPRDCTHVPLRAAIGSNSTCDMLPGFHAHLVNTWQPDYVAANEFPGRCGGWQSGAVRGVFVMLGWLEGLEYKMDGVGTGLVRSKQ